MSDNYHKKEDLRVRKTRKALIDAMLSLLKRKKFDRITVNDICEEALVSRASFYLHFENKFELVKYWIDHITSTLEEDIHNETQEQVVEKSVEFILTYRQVLSNLVDDYSVEILKYFFDALACVLLEKFSFINENIHSSIKSDLIVFEFFSGGLISLYNWQVKNNYRLDKNLFAKYIYRIIKSISEWDSLEQMRCDL